MSINILIVDDDHMIRESMKIILSMDNELNIIGTCKNGDEALKACLDSLIDVVVMDIRMPQCDGVLATKNIKAACPKTKIIILTTFDDDDYIIQALKNGAAGYLLKNTSPDKIIEKIKIIHKGDFLVDSTIASKITKLLHSETKFNLENYGLNKSEIDIVKLIANGLSNKEIAEQIFLSEGTVKNKITDILSKLELRDRTQIAIFYIKNGKI